MKTTKMEEMLDSIASRMSQMTDEEFEAEMKKAAEQHPDLLEVFTSIEEPELSPEAMSEYKSMPDTLDMTKIMQPPPFQLSIQEIDKIYHDAKNSTSDSKG